MFTGLVKTLGKITEIKRASGSAKLKISADSKLAPKIGDSIAVNGICLTVTDIDDSVMGFDISKETLGKTTATKWRKGDIANLEPALKAGEEIGGHFVSGHVDEVGKVAGIRKEDNNLWLKIAFSKKFIPYLVPQGSIAVDGISLTVAKLGSSFFEAAIIPHTLDMTNIKNYKTGTLVNLEADMLGKYIIDYLKKGFYV